jgi:chorismate mutase/prephenate dehydratase
VPPAAPGSGGAGQGPAGAAAGEGRAEPLKELRKQVSDNDRAIVEAINRRLELVAKIKRYKESNGIEFIDPDREAQMLEDLRRANRGPLSDEGLRRILRELLDLSKRETA